jgi:hypothetical protein
MLRQYAIAGFCVHGRHHCADRSTAVHALADSTREKTAGLANRCLDRPDHAKRVPIDVHAKRDQSHCDNGIYRYRGDEQEEVDAVGKICEKNERREERDFDQRGCDESEPVIALGFLDLS